MTILQALRNVLLRPALMAVVPSTLAFTCCAHAPRPRSDSPATEITHKVFSTREVAAIERAALLDCDRGRRLLIIAPTSVLATDRLRLITDLLDKRRGCSIRSATSESRQDWLFTSWPAGLPSDADASDHILDLDRLGDTPAALHQLQSAIERDCTNGRLLIAALPEPTFENKSKEILQTLASSSSACKFVLAKRDGIGRTQGPVYVALDLRDLSQPSAPPAPSLVPGSPERPSPIVSRKPSFDIPSVPLRLKDTKSYVLDNAESAARASGGVASLFRKKTVIVALWATWCKVCKEPEELRLIAKMSAEAKALGIDFLSLADGLDSPQQEIDDIRAEVQAKNFYYPLYVVKNAAEFLPNPDWASSLPLFLVVQDSMVIATRGGELDETAVRDLVAAAGAPSGKERGPWLAALLKVEPIPDNPIVVAHVDPPRPDPEPTPQLRPVPLIVEPVRPGPTTTLEVKPDPRPTEPPPVRLPATPPPPAPDRVNIAALVFGIAAIAGGGYLLFHGFSVPGEWERIDNQVVANIRAGPSEADYQRSVGFGFGLILTGGLLVGISLP